MKTFITLTDVRTGEKIALLKEDINVVRESTVTVGDGFKYFKETICCKGWFGTTKHTDKIEKIQQYKDVPCSVVITRQQIYSIHKHSYYNKEYWVSESLEEILKALK